MPIGHFGPKRSFWSYNGHFGHKQNGYFGHTTVILVNNNGHFGNHPVKHILRIIDYDLQTMTVKTEIMGFNA